eukprot:10218573-Lingulodinium_polyedra.AAC.1
MSPTARWPKQAGYRLAPRAGLPPPKLPTPQRAARARHWGRRTRDRVEHGGGKCNAQRTPART